MSRAASLAYSVQNSPLLTVSVHQRRHWPVAGAGHAEHSVCTFCLRHLRVMSLEWTHHALSNMRAIHAYIAQDSPANAEHVIVHLARAAEGLVTLPFFGQMSKDQEGVS